MKDIIFVFLGAGIGGSIRFMLQILCNKCVLPCPFSTTLVNLIGCLIIGIILGFFGLNLCSRNWVPFVISGILGGFTTFSAFSLETLTLIETGRTLYASLNVTVSVGGGLALTYGIYHIIRMLLT